MSEGQRQAIAGPAARKINRRPPGTALDGRSREFKLAQHTRAALVATVGGKPTVLQSMLIEHAVALTIHVRQLDNRVKLGEPLPTSDAKTYTALSNGLTRVLGRLATPPRPMFRARRPAKATKDVRTDTPTLAELIASHDAGDA